MKIVVGTFRSDVIGDIRRRAIKRRKTRRRERRRKRSRSGRTFDKNVTEYKLVRSKQVESDPRAHQNDFPSNNNEKRLIVLLRAWT